jgi:hypothetical protein
VPERPSEPLQVGSDGPPAPGSSAPRSTAVLHIKHPRPRNHPSLAEALPVKAIRIASALASGASIVASTTERCLRL